MIITGKHITNMNIIILYDRTLNDLLCHFIEHEVSAPSSTYTFHPKIGIEAQKMPKNQQKHTQITCNEYFSFL